MIPTWRACAHCGRSFLVTHNARAAYCSHKCAVKAWRRVAQLAGTHAFVRGQFKRVLSADNTGGDD